MKHCKAATEVSLEKKSREEVQFSSKKAGSWLVLDCGPVSMSSCDVGGHFGTYIRRKSRNTKNQIQLRHRMNIIFQRLGVVQILLVGFENGGAVHHRVQRRPLLEEDIDELI